eukprot:15470-Heterococcus_DN1.PRE.1
MEGRHKTEKRELEIKGRFMIKQANKNKKKAAEAEAAVQQMQFDLRHRHNVELAALEAAEEQGTAPTGSNAGDEAADADAGVEAVTAAAASLNVGSSATSADDDKDKRRAKAQKKKQKALEKELERERRVAEEKAGLGPDPRDIEMAALQQQLTPAGLAVLPMKSDGNCLYRAIAHQLALTGREPGLTQESYSSVRARAAAHLRAHRTDFEPFVEVADAAEYERYCATVESSAEWGGEVELRALSAELRVPIEVFKATESVPMVVGSEHNGVPLRITFHRHYYALGEHYNAVVSAAP